MVIIRRFIAIILTIFACGCIANAQSFKCEGTTYSSTGRIVGNATPISTPYTWQDNKGNKYPIYMSNSGSCYVIKTSKKTGKKYKQYLSPEISQDICTKLGKEYKGKKK